MIGIYFHRLISRIIDLTGHCEQFLQWEWSSVNNWIHKILLSKRHLGNPFVYEINKLLVLEKAKAAGLRIPHTFIGNTKESLLDFHNQNVSGTITKAIFNSFEFERDKKFYGHPTMRVVGQQIGIMPSRIGISLFQTEVEKRFDIRCCIVEKSIFCTAILSQDSDFTKVDYRNQDPNNPCREIPFVLDRSTGKKLFSLMDSLALNFGLIDLIMGVDNNIYFLEVNPIGQFGDLSLYGNFNVEGKIAKFLSNQK